MDHANFYPRQLAPRILEALADTPVVLLAGPRQAGKTTLAKRLAGPGSRYLTLDDELTLLSARSDPVGMIRGLESAVIDEVQRAPQLLLAIKRSVDEARRPGRFLLTGSADPMTVPGVADSLAGRMETLSLLPLSQSELQQQTRNWIDAAFEGRILASTAVALGHELAERVLRGGYPEAVARGPGKRRSVWLRQYVDALIQRDVRDLTEIYKADQLPRFLAALAQMAGSVVNYSQLAGQMGMDDKTAARYIGIFEQMYLLKRIPAWSRNRLKRSIKSPKLHFVDTGLLSMLAGLEITQIDGDKSRFGHVLENFVCSELMKHASTAAGHYGLYHYRDLDQVEVDIVIENASGDIVCVEVKSAATVRESDLRGIRKIAAHAGEKFLMGVVLYDGTETLPLGHQLWAAPLSTLWGS